jgi:hypothetical protein
VQFEGLPGIADSYFELPEVAWEHTLEKSVHLPRGAFTRLKVAAFSWNPQTLWFYSARSATWAQDSHQASERFNGFYGLCVFKLSIHNETADQTRPYDATISVATDRTLGFRLDAEGKNFGLHTMSPNRPVLGGNTGPSGVGA